jgi:PKD repeat protein
VSFCKRLRIKDIEKEGIKMNRNLIFKLLIIPLCCLGIILMLSTFYSITRAQDTNEPSVSITADVTTGTVPLAVSFTSTINDPFAGKYPITYEWHFDDGAASTKLNPKHTFIEAGEYHVICRVTFWKSPKVKVQGTIEINVTQPSWPAAVCTADGDQSSPQIASDGSGGAIITWKDNRGGNSDIYARRIDSTGKSLGIAEGVPICTAANNQLSPQITTDGSGGAIITWWDERSGNYDIYVQRIDSVGKPLWTANGVAICTEANEQREPQITNDSSGGAIITWQDERRGNYDIYAQRIDSAGKPLWTANGVAICTAGNNQGPPQITSDGSGGAIIAWEDNRSVDMDIYAQRIAGNGEILWTAGGVAICTATNLQISTQITPDGSGGAIITWGDRRRGDNWDIYARRIDSTGKSLWTADGVAICTAAYDQQLYPHITTDGSGGAIITWKDYRSNVDGDIYAQRIDSTGKLLWNANGVAICTADNYQQIPQITFDGSSGAIITWEDYRSGNYDIYAQHIDSTGKLLWTANGLVICAADIHQMYPQIAADGSGGAIITWQDLRSYNSDIYARRITKDGELK